MFVGKLVVNRLTYVTSTKQSSNILEVNQ